MRRSMTNSPGQLGHLGETKQVHVERLRGAAVPAAAAATRPRCSQPGSIDKMEGFLAAVKINQSINSVIKRQPLPSVPSPSSPVLP